MISEKLYTDGYEYYRDLLKDIRDASVALDLETYIFEVDTVGKQFVAALSEASRRGVEVRLLVDGNGIPPFSNGFLNQLERAKVKVRLFHPLPWRFWQWSLAVCDRPLPDKLIHLINGINHRNHRKVCVIDHSVAWVGSFNVSRCHLPKEKGGDDWRDTAIRLEGIQLGELEMAFQSTWKGRHFIRHFKNNPTPVASPRFRLNLSRRRRRNLYKDMLNRISQARQRIWITNAYFVPDEALLQRLKKAAQRGVDVRIILPSQSDIFFMPWTSAVFYHSLITHKVRIFEYCPGVLHAKTLILDDWMTVGSSNLNSRSLLHDLEADVVLYQDAAKKQLGRQFLNDMEQSIEILKDDSPAGAMWKKLFAHLLLSVKYWL